MTLSLSKNQLNLEARELLDFSIARFKDELAAHSRSVNVPAPTAYPLVEIIVKEHGGDYVLDETVELTLESRLASVESTLALQDRIGRLEERLGLASKEGTLDDRLKAIETVVVADATVGTTVKLAI